MSDCFLYWIRSPNHTDIFKDGYVGISYDPSYRLKQHIGNTKANHHRQNIEFKNALMSGDIIQDVLLKSTVEYCLEVERKLRPMINIGWNLAIGGDGGSVYKHGLTSSKVKRDYYNMLTRCREKGLSVCDDWLGEGALVRFNEFVKDKVGEISLPLSGEVSCDTIEFLSKKEATRKNRRKLKYNGKCYSVEELGEQLGIKPNTISTRLKRGWTVDEAVGGVRNVKC